VSQSAKASAVPLESKKGDKATADVLVVIVSVHHQVDAVLIEERFELKSQLQHVPLRNARAVHVPVYQRYKPPCRVPYMTQPRTYVQRMLAHR
jgi:hypothetical protein